MMFEIREPLGVRVPTRLGGPKKMYFRRLESITAMVEEVVNAWEGTELILFHLDSQVKPVFHHPPLSGQTSRGGLTSSVTLSMAGVALFPLVGCVVRDVSLGA